MQSLVERAQVQVLHPLLDAEADNEVDDKANDDSLLKLQVREGYKLQKRPEFLAHVEYNQGCADKHYEEHPLQHFVLAN